MALRALSTSEETFPTHRDLREWEVRTRVDDHRVGVVDDVLFDHQQQTRYFSVRVEDGRHVLIPCGHVDSDRERKTVWLPGMAAQTIGRLPEYGRDPALVTDAYEQRLWAALEAGQAEHGTTHHHERPDYSAEWSRGHGAEATGQLTRLDELDDYKVAEHDHDPRSWQVVGGDGEDLGVVDHLVGDTGAMKVRYLVVKLASGIVDGDRHMLVPAGHAHLDPEHKRVRVDALDRARVRTAPFHDGQNLRPEEEGRLRRFFDEGYAGDRRYGHPRYRDRLDYGERSR